MLRIARNEKGFALLEFVINFIIIGAVLATVFSVTSFVAAYVKALMLTQSMVVRQIELYGGIDDSVRANIGITEEGKPDGSYMPNSYIDKMKQAGLEVTNMEVRAYREGDPPEGIKLGGEVEKVQLRTRIKVTVQCKYYLVYYDFAQDGFSVPMMIASYGQTESFDPNQPYIEEKLEEDL